jgi:hypothetical protein
MRAHAIRWRIGLVSVACLSFQLAAVAEEPVSQPPSDAPGRDVRAAALDQAVKNARADLQERTKAPAEKIRTVSAEALLWLDTSMGCGTPTASYARIEVEGFQFVLEYDGKRFDYRSMKDGEPLLCQPKISTLPRD